MSIEYTVKLNNRDEVQAWEKSVAAKVKDNNALKENAKAYKNVNKEVEGLIRELKIEEQLEKQIASERKRNLDAGVRQYHALAEASGRAAAQVRAAWGGSGGMAMGGGRNPWMSGMAFNQKARLDAAMMPFTGAPDFASRIKKEQAVRADIARVEADQRKIVNAELVNASGGLSQLGRELLSFATVTHVVSQAISNAKEMMRFGAQQREAGAATLKSDFEVYREISEVSETAALGKARVAKYQQMRAQGLSRESAWETLEKAIATGNEGSVDKFVKTRGAMDPALAMSVGSHIETLFDGRVNEVEGANMVLEASKKSRYKVREFAPSAPMAAVGGTMAGSSAAETLAILSVMSSEFKGPEDTSQYMRYLGTRGKYMGIKSHDKGLMAMMEELSAMTPEERKDPQYAGERIQILSFVDKMSESRKLIREREREIIDAQHRAMGRDSNLERGQRTLMGLPGGPEILANQAALGEEQDTYRDEFGVQQLDVESTRARMRTRGVKAGRAVPRRWLEDKVAGGLEEAGVGARGIELAAPATTNAFLNNAAPTSVNLLIRIYEALTSIDKKTIPASKPAPNPNGGGRR